MEWRVGVQHLKILNALEFIWVRKQEEKLKESSVGWFGVLVH